MTRLSVRAEAWPLAGTFTISRGSRTETQVVVVELTDGAHTGRGECMANPRYGETQDGIVAAIEALRTGIESRTLERTGIRRALPAGAARSALDCAFWDLDSKRAGVRAWTLAGLPAPGPVETAYTLSLDTPERMAEQARANAYRPVLKLKVAGDGDLERVAAVRENAPEARLIVDANEGWRPETIRHHVESLAKLHVQLIEQPLPAGADEALLDRPREVPICADESCRTAADLHRLAGLYDVVNIKLDKAGGLTEALALRDAARQAGLGVMVGCMVATSLSMAPAVLVAQGADFVDLDGPLLLARDREPALRYDGGTVHPPRAALWG